MHLCVKSGPDGGISQKKTPRDRLRHTARGRFPLHYQRANKLPFPFLTISREGTGNTQCFPPRLMTFNGGTLNTTKHPLPVHRFRTCRAKQQDVLQPKQALMFFPPQALLAPDVALPGHCMVQREAVIKQSAKPEKTDENQGKAHYRKSRSAAVSLAGQRPCPAGK
ncbi:hypothetical protein ENROMA047B_22715 [Enterobacter rongchengensis]